MRRELFEGIKGGRRGSIALVDYRKQVYEVFDQKR